MNKFVKILTIAICFSLLLYLVCYWIGTWNFSIIKPGSFLHTDYVFNMEGSKWVCKSHNLEAVVTENSIRKCIEIVDLNTNIKYTIQIEGPIDATIHLYRDNPSIYDIPLSEVNVISKKRWRKLYKFVVKGVNKDCWYESGKDSISFELVEENDT